MKITNKKNTLSQYIATLQMKVQQFQREHERAPTADELNAMYPEVASFCYRSFLEILFFFPFFVLGRINNHSAGT